MNTDRTAYVSRVATIDGSYVVVVINKKTEHEIEWFGEKPPICNIDRRTMLGNPFRITKKRSRAQVVEAFRDLWNREDDAAWQRAVVNADGDFEDTGENIRNTCAAQLLKGLRMRGWIGLRCHCAPEPCHGDVIAEWLIGMVADEDAADQFIEEHGGGFRKTGGAAWTD